MRTHPLPHTFLSLLDKRVRGDESFHGTGHRTVVFCEGWLWCKNGMACRLWGKRGVVCKVGHDCGVVGRLGCKCGVLCIHIYH